MIFTDVVGIGDPFVLPYGDRYYMYATSAKDGFLVWQSDDLKTWKGCGYAYRMSADSFGYKDFWAPEVVYKDGKFIMHYTACSKKTNTLKIGVAVSDSPLGTFKDVVAGEPMFDFGYAAIDAHAFIDGEKSYLYFARDCSENIINGIHTSEIYVAPLSDDLLSVMGEAKCVLSPSQDWETRISADWRWNEGAFVVKHDGKYFLTYSGNCFESPDYGVGYAVSDSPTNGFIKAEANPVLKKIDGVISGPGHHCFFNGTDGQLYAAFHVHTDITKPSGNRRACFCPVQFSGQRLEFLL